MNFFKAQTAALTRKGKVDHNTFAIQNSDESISIRLYATDILRYFSPNSDKRHCVAISTGGHTTRTTHDRLNKFLPAGYHVKSVDFASVLTLPSGLTVSLSGIVLVNLDTGLVYVPAPVETTFPSVRVITA